MPMSKKEKSQRTVKRKKMHGFTLIETVTVFVIVAIIGYSISVMMTQVMRSYRQMKAVQEVMDISRNVISFLTSDVENAYISSTDNRFIFLGTNTTLDFNAISETSFGSSGLVELGYSRNGNNQIVRRFEAGSSLPNQVTSGGTSSIVADNVYSLAFQFVYRDNGGAFQMSVAWDSNASNYANYDYSGNAKNPDGLPEAVEITFSVRDRDGVYPLRTFTTKIYLPHDKYR